MEEKVRELERQAAERAAALTVPPTSPPADGQVSAG
jgi:hypothetical protein